MIGLEVPARVVSIRPDTCMYFTLPSGQLFELEFNTVYFAGDFVIVSRDGHRLLARVEPRGYRTRTGLLTPDECAVLARAIPIGSE